MEGQLIVLQPGAAPRLMGRWSVGQLLEAAEGLRQLALGVTIEAAPVPAPMDAGQPGPAETP
jgi:hypothetical protein